jgi:hypothetical protein
VSVGYSDIFYSDGSSYYNQSGLVGTLLSVVEINAITDTPPFVIPSGQIQIGWEYHLDSSYSTSSPANLNQLIDGEMPNNGGIYNVNATYNADTEGSGGGIFLSPVYGDPEEVIEIEIEMYENPLKKLKNANQYITLTREKIINNLE